MAKIFIDGDWTSSAAGNALPVIDPSSGEAFGEMADGGAADVDRAVAAARRAFEGPWGRLTATERGRLLTRTGVAILDHLDELTALESRDTGKPIGQARADVIASARYFEYYGGAADKHHGEEIPYLDGYFVAVVNEPLGVTGHILPWNYPAQMFGRTLAPSLAAGNATVLKPAEEACASILRLAELATDAGIPAGAINVVTGRGETAGAALASHRDVDFISFTGSPEVGQLVQKAAADHYAGCVLELGGKCPQLVSADAHFDAALPVIRRAIVQNAGQTCSAGSRVLVAREIYDDFIPRLAETFSTLKAGAATMDLDCGPVISAAQRNRVLGFIERARAEGVTPLAEGQLAADLPSGGYYVKPMLFGPVPRANNLALEEVFGPVLAALPFDDEEDAVRLANGTDYGLVAGIWTSDGARQFRVAKRLRCGQVFINGYGAGAGIELPFGGVRKSGHGREKGFAAMSEYSVTKTIIVKHG